VLSSKGGAYISESDGEGSTNLFLAAEVLQCHSTIVQWPLNYEGAQVSGTKVERDSVGTVNLQDSAACKNLFKSIIGTLSNLIALLSLMSSAPLLKEPSGVMEGKRGLVIDRLRRVDPKDGTRTTAMCPAHYRYTYVCKGR
jgi:hypothetical protein